MLEGIDARRIEESHLRCTRPDEEHVYDGWLVRRAADDIKRARSVNAFGPSTLQLDVKIEHCERLFTEAGLPYVFRITPFAPTELDTNLGARGYEQVDHTLQQVVSLQRPLPSAPEGVRVQSHTLGDWSDIAAALRHQTNSAREAEQRRLKHSPLRRHCLVAYVGRVSVACGLAMRDQQFATLMDIHVAEAWRHRGIGTAITAHLLAEARDDGASIAWLNVLADNTPAINAYARLGFETLYEYWYRVNRPRIGSTYADATHAFHVIDGNSVEPRS